MKNKLMILIGSIFVLTGCSTYKVGVLTKESRGNAQCTKEIDSAVKSILKAKGAGETPRDGYLFYLMQGSVRMEYPSLDWNGSTSYDFILNDPKNPKITLIQRTKGAATFSNTMKNGIKSVRLNNCKLK